jgi:hypothetical protein
MESQALYYVISLVLFISCADDLDSDCDTPVARSETAFCPLGEVHLEEPLLHSTRRNKYFN